MPDIDSILGNKSTVPYANTQPDIIVKNNLLSRFPPFATPEGVLPEFQQFFDNIVTGVFSYFQNQTHEQLYIISDGLLRSNGFYNTLNKVWGPYCSRYNEAGILHTNMDIELNVDRFQELHRNILGGIRILTYIIDICDDEFCEGKNTSIKIASTELLFTYQVSNNQFTLLSVITPFIETDV